MQRGDEVRSPEPALATSQSHLGSGSQVQLGHPGPLSDIFLIAHLDIYDDRFCGGSATTGVGAVAGGMGTGEHCWHTYLGSKMYLA